MNGGFEEVLMRAVEEVSDAVRPWLLPAVEVEAKRQLSADPASIPVVPLKRETRSGSGLQLTLTVHGIGPNARTRIALMTMSLVEDILRERLQHLVNSQIAKHRPISERTQREFDEWAVAIRERSARYSRLAELRASGRKFAAGDSVK
jgi:hypothetical protein